MEEKGGMGEGGRREEGKGEGGGEEGRKVGKKMSVETFPSKTSDVRIHAHSDVRTHATPPPPPPPPPTHTHTHTPTPTHTHTPHLQVCVVVLAQQLQEPEEGSHAEKLRTHPHTLTSHYTDDARLVRWLSWSFPPQSAGLAVCCCSNQRQLFLRVEKPNETVVLIIKKRI